MKQEALYDLIERYLNGALNDAEREDVERRLATDPDFQAEMNLHRDLRTELGDPDQLRLRTALDRFLVDPPQLDPAPGQPPAPARPSRTGWLRWMGLVGLVGLAGFFLWQRWDPSGETLPGVSPENAVPSGSSPVVPTPPDTPSQPPVSIQDRGPMAMTDPRDLVPNPALEDRLSDQMRGGGDPDIQIELSSPHAGTILPLQPEGVTLTFRGTVTGDSLPAGRPLRLFVYPNRPEAWDKRQPRYTLPFPVRPTSEAKKYMVRFQQRLNVSPGLYYLVVGQAREAADGAGYRALWFGKVVVQAAK